MRNSHKPTKLRFKDGRYRELYCDCTGDYFDSPATCFQSTDLCIPDQIKLRKLGTKRFPDVCATCKYFFSVKDLTGWVLWQDSLDMYIRKPFNYRG